ncbi:hypothetical protein U9M48_008395 [Paspalum notatum var. saurae]|uniref:DDE Tnp4 domain-containing protein n=1 Tax=Paspalum notatum var. saurae TaxID=547442 RepID=A0AAQ3SPA6_PASNO
MARVWTVGVFRFLPNCPGKYWPRLVALNSRLRPKKSRKRPQTARFFLASHRCDFFCRRRMYCDAEAGGNQLPVAADGKKGKAPQTSVEITCNCHRVTPSHLAGTSSFPDPHGETEKGAGTTRSALLRQSSTSSSNLHPSSRSSPRSSVHLSQVLRPPLASSPSPPDPRSSANPQRLGRLSVRLVMFSIAVRQSEADALLNSKQRFKDTPLENEAEMQIMFDAISVTNESSVIPGGGEATENEDEIVVMDEEGDGTPKVSPVVDKRKKEKILHDSPHKNKKKKTFKDECMKRLVDAYEMKAHSSKNSATSLGVDHAREEIARLLELMTNPSGTHESSDGTDDDDDFMAAYIALQCMDGNGGYSMNKKTRTLPVETGIQWVQRQLQDSDDCCDMFRMRRTVFRRLHETLGFLAPYKGQRYHVPEWQNGRHPVGSKEMFNYTHSSLRNVIERYPNRKGFLAPYKGQRYHVPEWQNGRHPVGSKEMFNYTHSSLRNVIERSFGVLKMKWRILLNLPSFPIKKQSKIIIAMMTLHNFIRESAIHDAHFEKFAREDSVAASQYSADDSSGQTDDSDMGAVRDYIANAMTEKEIAGIVDRRDGIGTLVKAA